MLDRQTSETTAYLELRALEKMIRALADLIERVTRAARARGELDSREADLQLQVFAERRAQAMQALTAASDAATSDAATSDAATSDAATSDAATSDAAPREPYAIRIARLERLVEALDCSRAYFRPLERGWSSKADA